jgi:hypothetical protein
MKSGEPEEYTTYQALDNEKSCVNKILPHNLCRKMTFSFQSRSASKTNSICLEDQPLLDEDLLVSCRALGLILKG